MKSAWVERDATESVARYAAQGIAADIALRVYTTRLLGRDPKLVLHGGGNTSVKTRVADLNGDDTHVLCVKGSGWDMATIEPPGMPAVRLEPLRKLRARDAVPDDEMVRVQRANLIDPSSPNPSVETLLHAFVPHTFVDHTHSAAVLGLIDQPDGPDRAREVYGARMGVVPYILPGFGLAKKSAEVFDADPKVEGLILEKHGIFTFGADAREAYERMIEMVTLAEQRLARGRKAVFVSARMPQQVAALADIAPILRGACALPDPNTEGAWKRFVLDFRTNDTILNFVNGADLVRYSQAGVITPDHTIRTKNWPLILPAPEAGKEKDSRAAAREAVASFVTRYTDYFARNNARVGGGRTMLDPAPRVALVPGVGLFGLGTSTKEARIAADLAEAAVEAITDAEATGVFTSITEAEMFDCEYWPLEQAKLGSAKLLPLAGQVAVVTGGAGAIGAATARAFAAAGAEVALLDVDADAVRATAAAIGRTILAVACDVTDAASVQSAFAQTVAAFGGVDILVSNAGAAWEGRIGDVDEALLRKSFELNFFAHQRMAQAAVRATAAAIGRTILAVACDVTDAASVQSAFAQTVAAFGGVDILVSNAGAAWEGRIGDVDEALLRKSFELNFFAHQRMAQAAVRVMLAQGTGGCLLFNVSKQAVNPGPNFGPYGLPKAATLFLVRQYALDHGADGIRANAVNADRIRSGLLTGDFIAARAKARGVSEKDYMSGNLLGREVTADDVAQAFLAQALALKTTASVTTVDGGNIAAALR